MRKMRTTTSIASCLRLILLACVLLSTWYPQSCQSAAMICEEDDGATNDSKALSKREIAMHVLRKRKIRAISILMVVYAYREEVAGYFYNDMMKPVAILGRLYILFALAYFPGFFDPGVGRKDEVDDEDGDDEPMTATSNATISNSTKTMKSMISLLRKHKEKLVYTVCVFHYPDVLADFVYRALTRPVFGKVGRSRAL